MALIAHEAGYDVSGSDAKDQKYIQELKRQGITDIHIGQTKEQIAAVHQRNPIDWYVHSSAVNIEDRNVPEIEFCKENGIKVSKRDELINQIIADKQLKLVAIAGTHGKSTTTAMLIWLFKQIDLPIAYSVGAPLNFGPMGHYQDESKYFIYEADEFDRNFLSFEPDLSVITGVSWDHHEIFPTRDDYQQAFREFIAQSKHSIIWEEDQDYLGLSASPNISVESSQNQRIEQIKLAGQYNKLDAYLAVHAAERLTRNSVEHLIKLVNEFPGLGRRMELIIKKLYSDYAHTPEKIRGAMSTALEMADLSGQSVIVIYEPLTDRRQHYILDNYGDCFEGAKKVYWLPSYLAREDPKLPILQPSEIIKHLDDPSIATPTDRGQLERIIKEHLKENDMVVCMNGGGPGSLDEWLRDNFKESAD